jgi:PBSX family phage terminase large subunit
VSEVAPFKRTERQKQATAVLAADEEAGLFGGSRSGKTFIIIRSIIIRALKTKSRHLIARFRFNHVKQSIWYDTLPKVLHICFPGLKLELNKSDWYAKFPNGSEIWFGGVDDAERVEKILGNEYSTIYLNEVSQIGYDAVLMLQTRLAENSGLALRMWYDFNPPSKKHWSYLYFIEGRDPVTLKPLPKKIPYLVMNPVDNRANLPESYIGRLERLPPKQRARFLSGEFTLDTEGALWNYELIIAAQGLEVIEQESRRVLAIDPAVTNNENSDETGIVVASKRANLYRVEYDYTTKASTQSWAEKALWAFEYHDCDVIVAETNNGGDLVENVLRLNGFRGRFIKVHAKKGKSLRAEPIVALYEQGLVSHADGLHELEGEMMEWIPFTVKDSPNRIDAAVYALTELSGADSMKELLELAVGA